MKEMKWLGVGFIIYSLLFIFQSSFIVGGERYFILFDDAMISMRYAWNLFHGNGLVWNTGEYVEGITNLLWTLYMSVWQWLPNNLTSLPIQLTGMLILLANIYIVYKIGGVIPATLTATYLPLNYWGLLGMETALVSLIFSLVVYLFIENKDRWGYVVLSLGFLVRPDILLLLPFILWWKKKDYWFAIGAALAVVGATEAFRYLYYGDLLPNTYYVKATGYPIYMRVTRSIFYLLKQYSVLIGIVVAFFFIFINFYSYLKKTRHQEGTQLLLGVQANNHFIFYIIIIQLAYNVYLGGDVWDFWAGGNRFVVSIAPLIFILFGRLVYHVLHSRKMLIPSYGKILMLGSFVFILNSGVQSELIFFKKPLYIEEHKQKTELALQVKEYKPKSIAVTWAGIIMYLNPESKGIDILGKSDRYVARLPAKETRTGLKKWIGFNPGHMKWDYEHSISEQRPEIITSLWNYPEEADLSNYKDTTLSGQQIWIRQ